MPTQSAMHQQLLTVKAAAARLGVAEATVRMWIWQRKNLEVVRIGRAVRVSETALERFICENTVPPRHGG
jgi:excisionase family DNA binding protein